MENYVVKYAGTGLAVLFSQLTANGNAHIEFIDPFCGIVKLGVLLCKPTGTKLSLQEHRINIQDSWKFQGLLRFIGSDDRDQLHQLRAPILYFRGLELGHIIIEQFDIDKELMAYIRELAIKGLHKLKVTYETSKKKGSMIKNCVDDYIRTLSHPYTKDEYMEEINIINKPTLFVIYNEFTKKWSNKHLVIIRDLFEFALSAKSENVANEIANAIDHFIMSKDLEIDVLRPD